MSRKKTRRKIRPMPTYSLVETLWASNTDPMAMDKIRHQMTRMLGGQRAMELDQEPTADDWRVVTDAVNLMDTMVNHQGGRWCIQKGEYIEIKDHSGLLPDAVQALATAARRSADSGVIRLDALGMQATRAVLQEYRAAIEQLPARIVLQVHRITEARIREIYQGRRQPHDEEVMAL